MDPEVGKTAASWDIVVGSAETAEVGIGFRAGGGRVVGWVVGCLLGCQVQ